jgi:hypothetical protein
VFLPNSRPNLEMVAAGGARLPLAVAHDAHMKCTTPLHSRIREMPKMASLDDNVHAFALLADQRRAHWAELVHAPPVPLTQA